MCNYQVQTVKRHILGQTATCAVYLCACVRLSAKTAPLLVFSVEMPHLWICSCKLCCVLAEFKIRANSYVATVANHS